MRPTLCRQPLSYKSAPLKKFSQVIRQVAQISNLLYRRFLICKPLEIPALSKHPGALPNAIRRYSRLEICATLPPFRQVCALTALVLFLAAPGCGKKEEGGTGTP